MFVTGAAIEVFGVSLMTALHQEIPEDKLSRVSAYDWFGSIAMVPIATALAGRPSEDAFRACAVPVGLRGPRRRGDGGGAVRSGRTESDAAYEGSGTGRAVER
jgi:hypothetical protein